MASLSAVHYVAPSVPLVLTTILSFAIVVLLVRFLWHWGRPRSRRRTSKRDPADPG